MNRYYVIKPFTETTKREIDWTNQKKDTEVLLPKSAQEPYLTEDDKKQKKLDIKA